MAENPKVTSKFDRMHGHPRQVHAVSRPGGTTTPDGADGAPGKPSGMTPSRGTAEHGRQTHYHPNDGDRMHHGDRAVHPSYGDSGGGDGEEE